MGDVVEFVTIQKMFHSMPRTKEVIPVELEKEWLMMAVCDYQLELGDVISYDDTTGSISGKGASLITARVLALMMYKYYLTRELNKVMAVNGIYAKDIKLTGVDGSKKSIRQEIDETAAIIKDTMHKLKQNCFG